MEIQLNCKYIKFLRKTQPTKSGVTLSRFELSIEVDIHANTIKNIEDNPNYNVGIFTLQKLANYYEVSLNSLIKVT